MMAPSSVLDDNQLAVVFRELLRVPNIQLGAGVAEPVPLPLG